MKSIYKYLIAFGAIATVGIIFYNKVYIPKITYKTVLPTVGDLKVEVFGIGNIGAKIIYNISAGVNAEVLSINTDEGKWVKKGDLLAKLDAVDLPIQLQESKISVKKSYSELIASKKELDSLKAQKHLALVTYNRYNKLKKQSFASQSEYDKAKADLEVIEAQMKATKARINSSKIGVELSKKSVEALEKKLSKYKIYAPVNGYVISKDTEVAQSILASQSLLKIVNPDDVWVKAYIDERISSEVKVGSLATIRLRSDDKKIYNGIVKRIVAQSDAITQEREVDVAFTNLPLPFYINDQAEVLIQTKDLKNITKIPANSVVYKNKISGVWVSNNSISHFKDIKIIAITDKEIAVDGLDVNDKIIIPSLKNKPLSEGMKVH